jgi:hypothetical protein
MSSYNFQGRNMIGRCLCGDVEYEVSGLSGNIYQCHCSLCRQQGGSFSNSGTIIPKSQLKWLKGQSRIKEWIKDTGFTSCFCTSCGSPTPNILRKLDYYWIPVGNLEDGPFKVVANLCLNSKASWATVSNIGKDFESVPDISDFITLLGNEPNE